MPVSPLSLRTYSYSDENAPYVGTGRTRQEIAEPLRNRSKLGMTNPHLHRTRVRMSCLYADSLDRGLLVQPDYYVTLCQRWKYHLICIILSSMFMFVVRVQLVLSCNLSFRTDDSNPRFDIITKACTLPGDPIYYQIVLNSNHYLFYFLYFIFFHIYIHF